MAKYTKVEQLQKHLEIDYLSSTDEKQLQLFLDASESRIEREINQPLDTFIDDNGELDSALVAAILIFSGTLYANREAVAYTNVQPVPYTLHYLLQPFRKYT